MLTKSKMVGLKITISLLMMILDLQTGRAFPVEASADCHCTDDCAGLINGNYQSCYRCDGYVTCKNGELVEEPDCPSGKIWDDFVKSCQVNSATCFSLASGEEMITEEPVEKEVAAPTVEAAAATNVEEEAAPTVEAAAATNVEKEAAPTVEAAAATNVEEGPAPAVVAVATTNVEEGAAPAVEAAAATNVEEEAAPTVEAAAATNVEEEAAPTVEAAAATNVEEEAAPTVEAAAATNVEEGPAPAVEAAAATNVEEEAEVKDCSGDFCCKKPDGRYRSPDACDAYVKCENDTTMERGLCNVNQVVLDSGMCGEPSDSDTNCKRAPMGPLGYCVNSASDVTDCEEGTRFALCGDCKKYIECTGFSAIEYECYDKFSSSRQSCAASYYEINECKALDDFCFMKTGRQPVHIGCDAYVNCDGNTADGLGLCPDNKTFNSSLGSCIGGNGGCQLAPVGRLGECAKSEYEVDCYGTDSYGKKIGACDRCDKYFECSTTTETKYCEPGEFFSSQTQNCETDEEHRDCKSEQVF